MDAVDQGAMVDGDDECIAQMAAQIAWVWAAPLMAGSLHRASIS